MPLSSARMRSLEIDRDSMRVAAQVVAHWLGAGNGRVGVDDPRSPMELGDQGVPRRLGFEGLAGSGKAELPTLAQVAEHGEEFAAKEFGERPDGGTGRAGFSRPPSGHRRH